MNKLALGIADNYALSRITSSMAAKIPVVILPAASDFASLPQYRRSVSALRKMGVEVLQKERNEKQIGWKKALNSVCTQFYCTAILQLTECSDIKPDNYSDCSVEESICGCAGLVDCVLGI
jgi:phosphopantothenoylcysteine synthetase/decarboxylase